MAKMFYTLDEAAKKLNKTSDQVKKMVTDDPTSAAQIMRKWLYE